MVVELEAVKFCKVELAVLIKPLRSARVVPVAFSPVLRVLQAKAPSPPAGQDERQSPERQKMVVARFVVVALVPSALVKERELN